MPEFRVSPAVANCPPSAKLAHLIIDECGPLNHSELRARTTLSVSTLGNAVGRLDDAGAIETLPASDGRSRVYRVGEG